MATQTSLLPGLDMIAQFLTQQAKKKTFADYNEKIATLATAKDDIELGNMMTQHMKAIQTDTFLDPQEQNLLVQNLGQQASVRGSQLKKIEEDKSATQIFQFNQGLNKESTYGIGGEELTNQQLVEKLQAQGFTKPQDLLKAYEVASQNKTQTVEDVSLTDRNKGTFQFTRTRFDPVTKKAYQTQTGIIKNYGNNPYADINKDNTMQSDEQLNAITSRDYSKEKETWYKDQLAQQRENRIEAKQDEQIKLAKVQNWVTTDGDVISGYPKSNGKGGISVFSMGGFNITGRIKSVAGPYTVPKEPLAQDFSTASRFYNKSAVKLQEFVTQNPDLLPNVSKEDVAYNSKDGAVALISNNFIQNMGTIKTKIFDNIKNSDKIPDNQKEVLQKSLWDSQLDQADLGQLRSLGIIENDKTKELLENWQDYKNADQYMDNVTGNLIKKRFKGQTPSVSAQSLNVEDYFKQ